MNPKILFCNTSRVIIGIFVLLSLLCHSVESSCLEDIKVSGPGWSDPRLILPSRYFFIEYPEGCVERIHRVVIKSPDGPKECPHRLQVLNETLYGNDMTVVRYKLYVDKCKNGIIISLLDKNGVEVRKQQVTETIYDEICSCPTLNFTHRMMCQTNTQIYQQLENDLSHFMGDKRKPFKSWLEDAKKRFEPFSRSYSFCHYKIVDNQIYRRCYGEYVGFSQFFDDILSSLSRKVMLPNTQFLVNLGDWPLSSSRLDPLPIFSWCGSNDTHDIVIPTYELTEAVLNMQGRVSVDLLSVFGKQKVPFDQKLPKVFWRGRDSNRMRLLLVYHSKQNPDIIDAALTNFFFFREKSDLEKYGPNVPYSNFFDFFNYKYLISVDGTVAAYRLPNLLAGSSLVIKQESKYYEHFYHMIQSGTHYVSVKEDLTDFFTQIKRLNGSLPPEESISSDQQKQMIKNSRTFALEHLLPTNIYCYYYQAISEYTKRLLSEDELIEIDAEDEKVVDESYKCSCDDSKGAFREEL